MWQTGIVQEQSEEESTVALKLPKEVLQECWVGMLCLWKDFMIAYIHAVP